VADKFLTCGVLEHGFIRIRREGCAHESLLAFSCKCRYCCPSCHAKRLAIWTQWLDTTLLAPVPHRQVVLTIPRRARARSCSAAKRCALLLRRPDRSSSQPNQSGRRRQEAPVTRRLAHMSDMTQLASVASTDKPLVWLRGEVKTPPFSPAARLEAGVLLPALQRGRKLGLPHVRLMPTIGPRCHELRIRDADVTWRIVYRPDASAIVMLDVFARKTQATPHHVIDDCKRRLRQYDALHDSSEA
jgi:phage-related protein